MKRIDTKRSQCYRMVRWTLAATLCRHPRQGSTLLVIVALMGMLALLGVTFFAFASQEAENAKNFQKAAEIVHDPELGPDVYFDWALRQMIVGPNAREKNSALFGGHMSILPNAYGRDAHPHTGSGLRLVQDRSQISSGVLPEPFVDLDGDDNPDFIDFNRNGALDSYRTLGLQAPPESLLNINRSPAANVLVDTSDPGNNVGFEARPDLYPEPDVDYTYPDINNAFLAHIGFVPYDETQTGIDINGINGATERLRLRLVKPSYWRPELLQRLETNGSGANDEDTSNDGLFGPQSEDANGDGFYNTGDFNGDGSTNEQIARLDPTWYWAPWSRSRVLRAHPEHYVVPRDAQIPPTQKRYLNDNDPTGTDQPLIAGLPGGSQGFPFAGHRKLKGPDRGRITIDTSLYSGVWRGANPSVSAEAPRFDVDADGDGIFEAILMDLDFPVQERPSDGALYIPMFAMTVYDAEGLINLNTHGNLSGDTTAYPVQNYFGNGEGHIPPGAPGQFKTVSKSLQGVSASEVNPAWALDAVPDPTTLSSDFVAYFGHAPADRWELANMEQWWRHKGRIDFSSTVPKIHGGVLGDANSLWSVLQAANMAGTSVIEQNFPSALGGASDQFPFPGVLDRDDNRNHNAGGRRGNFPGAGMFRIPDTGQPLAFQHPISFSGRGRFTPLGDPRRLDRFRISGNPNRFLRYSDFATAGFVEWNRYLSSQLMPSLTGSLAAGTSAGANFLNVAAGPDGILGNGDDVKFLAHDFNEVVLEPRSIQRPHDAPLTLGESSLLHMSQSDINQVGVSQRLHRLMPTNIDAGDNSTIANERRRRFTTSSWDRKQFNLPRLLDPGQDGKPGVADVDDNRNGVVDDVGELGWPMKPNGNPTDDLRAWEFSADIDGDQRPEFPPAGFNSGSDPVRAYAGYHPNSPFPGVNPTGTIAPDPFRPQLRRLLETEFGNRDELKLQFRLNLNQLLDVVRSTNGVAHPFFSPLQYRPLTAHVRNSSLTTFTSVPAGESVPPWNSSDPKDREFWARYDRQRMARDMYVMLYMLCGGNDTHDYRLPNGSDGYTDEELQRMAQFAVNCVDAMDRDNVITRFEFDTNLSNGWNLDDQPWTDDGSSDRQVVFGVEAQEVTFNETLWVFQKQYSGSDPDHDQTLYDETTQDHHFLYMELANVAPKRVQLYEPGSSTTEENAIWRIRRRDAGDIDDVRKFEITDPDTVTSPEIALYFRRDPRNEIAPGGVFTIATGDNYSGGRASNLYVDYDLDNDFELIAPNVVGGASVPDIASITPQADLDLVDTNASSRFVLFNDKAMNQTLSTDEFLNKDTAAGREEIVLVLERRLNPDLPEINDLELNPWVTVDVTRAERKEFRLSNTPGNADDDESKIKNKLARLKSNERREPLDADRLLQNNGNGSGIPRFNSLSRTNFRANNPYKLVQPHFDRDFTSAIELLSVPVNGPDFLTRTVIGTSASAYDQMKAGDGPFDASGLFLLPSPPDQGATGSTGSTNWNRVGPPGGIVSGSKRRFPNHWHRLLSFVEVPSQSQMQLGGPFATTRVPGKINLNTIRHPEVLAALIDDPELMFPTERDLDGDGMVTAGLEDYNGNSAFDYGLPGQAMNDGTRDWWLELLASRDGLHPETGLALPGLPHSRPFRDPALMADTRSITPPTSDVPVPESPTEDSILRSYPDAAAPPAAPVSPRGLFDIGTAADANQQPGTTPAPGAVLIENFNRRRILSKIAGNSTTRSNVFYVFIHVQFHEAYEDPATGAIRVGGRIDLDTDGSRDDGHRGFFIVDRSDAERAYDTRTGTFNWEELVKHRLTIN